MAASHTCDTITRNSNPGHIPAAQDVLVQDPAERLSELPNAIGVDEGIYDGVSMGEDNGNVHQPNVWPVTVLTQVVKAVDDVQWQPTEGKQTYDDGQ